MGNCSGRNSRKNALKDLEVFDNEKFVLIEDKGLENLEEFDNKKLIKDQKGGIIRKNQKISCRLLTDDCKWKIRTALMRSGIFANVRGQLSPSDIDIDNIVNAFVLRDFKKSEVMFEEDHYPCNDLFIVKEGSFRGSQMLCGMVSMKRSDIIGELSFFLEVPHILSIVADENNSSAYCLSKRDYRAIIEKGRDMRKIKLFRSLSDDQKSVLKANVTILNVLKGSSNLF
jgi:hypothetical protein